ncbi:hypothetical protein STEG23_015846 [Scotinomys teguina]
MSTPSRFKKDKEIIAEYESQVKGKLSNEDNSFPQYAQCSLKPFLPSHLTVIDPLFKKGIDYRDQIFEYYLNFFEGVSSVIGDNQLSDSCFAKGRLLKGMAWQCWLSSCLLYMTDLELHSQLRLVQCEKFPDGLSVPRTSTPFAEFRGLVSQWSTEYMPVWSFLQCIALYHVAMDSTSPALGMVGITRFSHLPHTACTETPSDHSNRHHGDLYKCEKRQGHADARRDSVLMNNLETYLSLVTSNASNLFSSVYWKDKGKPSETCPEEERHLWLVGVLYTSSLALDQLNALTSRLGLKRGNERSTPKDNLLPFKPLNTGSDVGISQLSFLQTVGTRSPVSPCDVCLPPLTHTTQGRSQSGVHRQRTSEERDKEDVLLRE